jgi:hypothetical protein
MVSQAKKGGLLFALPGGFIEIKKLFYRQLDFTQPFHYNNF